MTPPINLGILASAGGSVVLDEIFQDVTPAAASGEYLSTSKAENDLHLVGARGGEMYTSPDGVNWTSYSVPYDGVSLGWANDFTYDGSKYYVAMYGYAPNDSRNNSINGGAVLSTTNFVNWQVELDDVKDLSRIDYGNGLFITSGTYNRADDISVFYRSTNGSIWTSFQIPGFLANVRAIFYAEGLWLVGGNDGLLFTSPDGYTWTQRSLPGYSNDVQTIIYGNGRYTMAGYFSYSASSPDGVTWTATTTPNKPDVGRFAHYGAFALGASYMGSSQGYLVKSTDGGLTWTEVTTFPTNDEIGAISFNGNSLVITTTNGKIFSNQV